jgi:tetratricopeptide (TPR) repeat protein
VRGLRGGLIVMLIAACSPALPHRDLASAALARGDVGEALSELRLSVAVAPRDGRAHAALGLLYLRLGWRGGALRELAAARALGSSDGAAELARLYAARARQRAVWRDPDRLHDWVRAGETPDPLAAADLVEAHGIAGGDQPDVTVITRDPSGLRAARELREQTVWAPVCAEDLRSRRALEAALGRPDGERLARDYVDGELSSQCRAPEVAGLYAARGDYLRARAWLDEALTEAPARADLATRAAEISARAGDVRRAGLFLEQAEYWSVVRGLASTRIAAVYLELGRPIDAMIAARQAISLGDPGAVRQAGLRLAAEAADQAGRPDDAARAREALERDAAR